MAWKPREPAQGPPPTEAGVPPPAEGGASCKLGDCCQSCTAAGGCGWRPAPPARGPPKEKRPVAGEAAADPGPVPGPQPKASDAGDMQPAPCAGRLKAAGPEPTGCGAAQSEGEGAGIGTLRRPEAWGAPRGCGGQPGLLSGCAWAALPTAGAPCARCAAEPKSNNPAEGTEPLPPQGATPRLEMVPTLCGLAAFTLWPSTLEPSECPVRGDI